MPQRLKIAIQKKGRLNSDSISLLSRAGLKFQTNNNALISRSENLPIDILFVRDDDIPAMIMKNVCDLGIIGENVLLEKEAENKSNGLSSEFKYIMKLGFGRCRLSIAVPENKSYQTNTDLNGTRIATSYPNLLKQYLKKIAVNAEVLSISGSVEIAPRLGMSEAICDLVSSGKTLEENQLKEVEIVLNSEALLIQSNTMLKDKEDILSRLLCRIQGVISAQESKYIMFHIDKSTLNEIKNILPSFESPTLVPLDGQESRIAVHLVSPEAIFWDTLEKLKSIGASSILVLPIEKMMS